MNGDRTPGVSAVELAMSMGESLPWADSITDAELELAAAGRALLDAIAASCADDAVRGRLAAQLRAISDELLAGGGRDPVRLVRHPDGRIENLIQAGTGRLNPRSLRIDYDDDPATTAVHGTCVLGASAVGPPGRAHGGVVASILDEALGRAMTKAGRTGMTVTLDVTLAKAVPLGTELEITGGVVSTDGRKTYAEAAVLVDGTVLATGKGLFVASRA